MNPEESFGDFVTPVESQQEEKEKTICARLVLTKEQLKHCVAMENDTVDLSVTAEFSEKDHEELKNFGQKKIEPKLILTDEQASDLRKAFNLLDYTGEGKIKAEDFRVAIKALGYEPTNEELQKMISAVDKGQTGKLNFENFETAIMRKVIAQDTDGDIMKSFRLFDMNDNGFISFENLKRVTEILGTYLTDEEIEEMIDDADKDFDGYVSVQEFMRMIKNTVNIITP